MSTESSSNNSSKISILLNDNEIELKEKTTLTTLLEKEGLSSRRGIAVAINSKVIGKGEWVEQILSDGDSVLVIQATQGG